MENDVVKYHPPITLEDMADDYYDLFRVDQSEYDLIATLNQVKQSRVPRLTIHTEHDNTTYQLNGIYDKNTFNKLNNIWPDQINAEMDKPFWHDTYDFNYKIVVTPMTGDYKNPFNPEKIDMLCSLLRYVLTSNDSVECKSALTYFGTIVHSCLPGFCYVGVLVKENKIKDKLLCEYSFFFYTDLNYNLA